MLENKKQLLEYLSKEGKAKSWNELAEMFGFSTGEAARSFVKRTKQSKVNYLRTEGAPLPTAVITTTNTYIYDPKTKTAKIDSERPLTTEEAVLDYCKLDQKEWEVKEIWSKEKQTNAINHPSAVDGILSLYETTAKIHPKEVTSDYKQEFEKFVNNYDSSRALKVKQFTKQDRVKPNILIISLTDLHFDKKTYFEETEEHGDMDISKSRALTACIDIVDRATDSYELSKIVILGGHDLLHANSASNMTEKGTKLDVDGRWHESFKGALELLTTIIDYCLEIAPVEYFNVIGNHGPERDHYLAVALEAFYRTNKNVFVENIYNYRKYFSFGRSAFMLTHEVGNKIKDLPIIFATERPDMFSRCKYRFVLSGHFHKTHETQFVGTNENYGIVFKVMPSLSSTDKWHYQNGYIGNQKSCIGLVINEDYGLISEIIFNE